MLSLMVPTDGSWAAAAMRDVDATQVDHPLALVVSALARGGDDSSRATIHG